MIPSWKNMHFQNCKKAGGKEIKKLYNFYKKGKNRSEGGKDRQD